MIKIILLLVYLTVVSCTGGEGTIKSIGGAAKDAGVGIGAARIGEGVENIGAARKIKAQAIKIEAETEGKEIENEAETTRIFAKIVEEVPASQTYEFAQLAVKVKLASIKSKRDTATAKYKYQSYSDTALRLLIGAVALAFIIIIYKLMVTYLTRRVTYN